MDAAFDLFLLLFFCLRLDVQPCSAQQKEESGLEGVNTPYGAHRSPLTGEMGGRTGQLCDSSRDCGGEGVSFAPNTERGEVLSGFSREDKGMEGNSNAARSSSGNGN